MIGRLLREEEEEMCKTGDNNNDIKEDGIVSNHYINLISKINTKKIRANKDIINSKKIQAQVFTVSVGKCT